ALAGLGATGDEQQMTGVHDDGVDRDEGGRVRRSRPALAVGLHEGVLFGQGAVLAGGAEGFELGENRRRYARLNQRPAVLRATQELLAEILRAGNVHPRALLMRPLGERAHRVDARWR